MSEQPNPNEAAQTQGSAAESATPPEATQTPASAEAAETPSQTAQPPAPEPAPKPATPANPASAADLQQRLKWGEPALTIIDVRDREAFNQERILGAVSMPLSDLSDMVAQTTLEPERDIYLYGQDDSQTAQAASLLRDRGFSSVAELKGGLSGWKASDGAVEGAAA